VLSIESLALADVCWDEIDQFPDRTIFQSQNWLKFLQETQSAKPVIAAIRHKHEVVGYFTGLIVKRFGFKILGSPFKGWTTPYMGFNLRPDISRREAVSALAAFGLHELKCDYLELMDPYLQQEDWANLPFQVEQWHTFHVQIAGNEDAILANMENTTRWSIRKAAERGVTIEEASDLAFADDYYDQLVEVFARQSRTPTYPRERVVALIRHLLPTGNLLLLRARNADGLCIATGIFPGLNELALYWGGASKRDYHSLRSNDALMWYALRYWNRRGLKAMDLGGAVHYKKKYGVQEVIIPLMMKGKRDYIVGLRNMAQRGFKSYQRLLARIAH
jgi:hypothetical protein